MTVSLESQRTVKPRFLHNVCLSIGPTATTSGQHHPLGTATLWCTSFVISMRFLVTGRSSTEEKSVPLQKFPKKAYKHSMCSTIGS